MEYKIGEIFEYNGEWYQCVEGNDCANCNFIDYCKSHSKEERDSAIGLCVSFDRSDGTHVVFKKLEKVGEPYNIGKKVFQRYEVFTKPYIFNDAFFTINTPVDDSFISIEIKQNEDMGETNANLSNSENIGKNLKPFSLEAAKAGKPVCTRDGRKARIICFDRVTNSTNEYTGHLIVLVTNPNGDEQSFYYTEKGNLAGEDEYDNHKWDLMMFPEKKEGWVNIYPQSNIIHMAEANKGVYPTEAIAKLYARADCIATVPVEWEE